MVPENLQPVAQGRVLASCVGAALLRTRVADASDMILILWVYVGVPPGLTARRSSWPTKASTQEDTTFVAPFHLALNRVARHLDGDSHPYRVVVAEVARDRPFDAHLGWGGVKDRNTNLLLPLFGVAIGCACYLDGGDTGRQGNLWRGCAAAGGSSRHTAIADATIRRRGPGCLRW